MKKLFLFIFFLFLLSSCMVFVPTIVRWPDNSMEKGSRTLPFYDKADIFTDFLWTTPDIFSREINDTITWKDESFPFKAADDILTVDYHGEEISFHRQTSKNNYYPDISHLEPKTVFRQRWVAVTKTVPEQVLVWKTRQVPRTNFNPDGTVTTTWVTESYTEWETHFVTKTEWEWQTYPVTVYDIPEYTYYNVQLPGEEHFLVYEIIDNKRKTYYIQNPSYIMVQEKEKEFWGEKNVNIIFIDADSNGIFFEENDKVLFNVWNPYNKNSSYKSLPRLMDNEWYTIKDVKDSLFITFEQQGDTLFIWNENGKYLDSKKTGKIIINNFDSPEYRVIVNGNNYTTFWGTKYWCEYGKYKIILSVPGHLDYEEIFVVDDKNPEKIINYTLTKVGGSIKIKNLFADSWKVMIHGNGIKKTLYSADTINLPAGNYDVDIHVHGFILSKTVTVTSGEQYIINFEKEIRAGEE